MPIFANARGQFTIAQPVRLPNALGKAGQAGSPPTQSLRRVERAQVAKIQSKIFERALIPETPQNLIFPIEMMNLTFELTMANIEGE